jgi:cell wall-associated NlpC family hydrolase
MRTSRSRVLVLALVLLALLPGVGRAVPDELTDRLDRAQEQLEALDARVSTAVEDYNAAAARLEDLRASQQETSGRVDALGAEVQRLEAATASFVRSMYIRGPATDLGVALDSQEVSQAGRDMAVMDRLSRQRHAELEQLGVRRAELRAAREQLDAQVSAAARREQELADRRAEVEQLVADQREQVEELQQEIEQIRAREAAEAERRRREAAERAAREAAAAQAAEEAAAEAAARQAAAEATREPAPAAPEPPPAPAPPAPGTRAGANTAVQAALSQVGKPYRWGGAGPDAYDCSGLTQWAWAHAGVSLPHSSRMQYATTTRITRAQLQPGDLIFYGSPIHHVAMYIGGTRVVEAPYSGSNVRVREDGLLRSDIVGYGRV